MIRFSVREDPEDIYPPQMGLIPSGTRDELSSLTHTSIHWTPAHRPKPIVLRAKRVRVSKAQKTFGPCRASPKCKNSGLARA
jgi:hypothetical protein